jgi:hypothetical protein
MIHWHDKSDRRSAFFDGQVREDGANSVEAILADMLAFLIANIIGKGHAIEFDKLLLEINCDTGQVLAAATTEDRTQDGRSDGCAVRIQQIQDHWYDLVDGRPTDEEFMAGIANEVSELGRVFRDLFVNRLDELRKRCSKHGFEYIVYGSEPGLAYFRERFTH